MHCDAIIAIAAAQDGERLTKECFGGRLGWIPWQRPGFDLGLKVGEMSAANPALEGLILGSHGLVTWGTTAKESYRSTLRVIQEAADWLDAKSRPEPFGPLAVKPLPDGERKALLTQAAPILRGLLSARTAKVMHHVETAEVLDFAGRARCAELVDRGTTCPDHFLRTKVKPLFVPFDPAKENALDLLAKLPGLVEKYRQDYEAYYERCKQADSPKMRDPYPVLVLIPGLGMLAFHRDKATARYASEYYVQTIHVMRWAEGVSSYAPISEKEAFGIEYWVLEERKLQLLPKPRSLDGRVALVTGGAGGIGSATARRLLGEGANLVLVDIDPKAADDAAAAMQKEFGADRVQALSCDVTDENQVRAAFASAVTEYGGVDIVVSNAGIASAAPVESTTLEVWSRNVSVLATGYFLVSREAFRLLRRQGRGGAIVFVGSKNALVASAGASAYCTAKAAELHLARCLALEGAEAGIRVNVVNPDAVIRGSRIWSGNWKQERAESNKIREEEVEEFYRQRSLLKRSVFPEDIAEAVYFLASDLSAKSTGNIVNVDAGNLTAFTR
jgi:rhamnulose-1-phosphate aldolase/alcohol dehydrogenase